MSAAPSAFVFTVLAPWLSVSRLPAGAAVPDWALRAPFSSITRTDRELSIVCTEEDVPAGVRAEKSFRALRVEGTLDFSLVGVLASLTAALAREGISVFVISTHDTDYLLVKEYSLARAVAALRADGHEVRG